MPRGDESPVRHRLATPDLQGSGPSRESRSRLRQEVDAYRSRSRLRSHDRELRERSQTRRNLERELERERALTRMLEETVRRGRSRSRRSPTDERSRVADARRDRSPIAEERIRRRGGSGQQRRSLEAGRSVGTRDYEDDQRAPRNNRSDSPTFTSKDMVNLIQSLGRIKSQPSTLASSFPNSSMNHKNILPDFDPSSKTQRIDIWLKKVNECATVYGWDEKITIHFAMQKLQGLAKTWYESLNTILFTWAEWQQKLLNAFPYERNFGQSLEDMLKRKSRVNEPLEVYYYEKLAMLNQCDIEGKRAVDCIIHGLSDKTIKSSANALRCTQPDQLLQFLMCNKETPQFLDRMQPRFKPPSLSTGDNRSPTRFGKTSGGGGPIFCFNCKEKGHPYSKCPKPLIQCTKCRKFGHKIDNCMVRVENVVNKSNNVSNTMRISTSGTNAKFIKESSVNGVPLKSFVDFGSEVSLITRSAASSLGLASDNAPTRMKGFGNDIVYSSGGVIADLNIDGVCARVPCQVVEDNLLDVPVLVGQTFTEQPHIIVYKNAEKLQFYDINNELPLLNDIQVQDRSVKVSVAADVIFYGPVSVKSHIETDGDGQILLSGKIVGKPNQQFMISGGIYQFKDNLVNVDITPLSGQCQLQKDMGIGRGTQVQTVHRINALATDEPLLEHSDIDESKVNVSELIDKPHRKRLIELLNRYKHCFASSLKQLGCTNIAEMNIELNNKRPVVYRPYRLSHKEREQVREMIGEMMDAGIVRESVSEYASPIILVRKKDGNLRLCIDYRQLNSITVKERYPMPVIEDEIARLSGQAYFVTLDMASGYYQVPIAEASKPLTSFVTPDGQYEFNRMPFGLANAPAVFQRMMNRLLGSARFSEATAYIDDVLIYGTDVYECLERLERVLQLIEKANLTLNLSKCNFLQESINYLGYEISAAGVRPGDKKIQSVQNFPCPTDPHSVRQFLGLVGYFRKFIRNFAAMAHPLNKLLKKDATWEWTNEQSEAFESLKLKLIDRPILAIYDPAAVTELHTDASKIGIGGILLQRRHDCSSFQSVAYYSRQTSPEEKNFHAFELETLAVICSLKKFRVYLLGQNFKIVTDCSALRSTFAKRDLIPRIARWWLLLQEFQCTVEYRAGTKMSHVDALSRNPISTSDSTVDPERYPIIMTISNDDWLQTLQLGDSEISRIRDILTTDIDADGLKYIRDNYVIKEDKLYKCIDGDKSKLRWVVPKGARWQLCRLNHDDIGHFGLEKTLERIKRTYWFPKMSRFVKKYVQACMECAYSKKVNSKEGHLHTIPKIEVPFHTLHLDHLGPFVRSRKGNCYLLVIVDAFTKFAFVRPVRNTKTQTALRVLEDIFYIFRNPDRVISDRGTCFTSHAFKRFCLDKGIKHVLNAVASPRSNGQVERYNRTILDSLTAQNLNHDEKDWDDKVGIVQWGMNNTRQKTTGRTPAEVMFGPQINSEMNPKMNEIVYETQDNNCNLETIREAVKDKIDEEQEKQKRYYNKNRRPARIYSEGELVKITKTSFNSDGKSKKLLPAYVGPYRVVEVLGNDRYRLSAVPGLSTTKNKRKTTVAADRMLPWVHVAALDVNDIDDSSDVNDVNGSSDEDN